MSFLREYREKVTEKADGCSELNQLYGRIALTALHDTKRVTGCERLPTQDLSIPPASQFSIQPMILCPRVIRRARIWRLERSVDMSP